MTGATFTVVDTRRPDLRLPFPDTVLARLVGQRVDRVERRAKTCSSVLDSGDVLLMHLGMSGSFRVSAIDDDEASAESEDQRDASAKHDHVVFGCRRARWITFNDPRRFGFDGRSSSATSATARSRKLGPEPLAATFNAAALARACKGKKVSLKVALLDQRIVAGLGNIYVAEALNRARLSPAAPRVDAGDAPWRPAARGGPARRRCQEGPQRRDRHQLRLAARRSFRRG